MLAGHPDAGTAQPERRGFDVEHYAAEVRLDIAGRVAHRPRDYRRPGHHRRGADAHLRPRGAGHRRRVDWGESVQVETPDRVVVVHLPAPLRAGQPASVTIDYHGSPPNGLVFAPERRQAYTIFTTRQWMVCVDEPDDKATLDLRVTVPRELQVVASGAPVGRTASSADTAVHHWRQRRPVSTFTFGFAAGRFSEATAARRATTLRYLGDGVSPAELTRAFADTADMLAFFERRAGVPYPAESYTQVLVANTAGQEAAGFSMLSEAYGRRLLGDPSALSLSAHELAHQWWGVLVTCLDWRHFWLNEGFATFMAAAYVEHRFGREAYLRDVAGWRATYDRVRQAKGDRSLVFPDWNRPTADDRALVYEKGAYVLHLLREHLGDAAFWDAIRRYTRAYAGRSVTTEEFQRAIERATGRRLTDFFAATIHRPAPTIVAKWLTAGRATPPHA